MKNKGFTLIELIVTLGIMVLVGFVIVINMSGILSKNEDENYETFKKKLEESACTYVELVKIYDSNLEDYRIEDYVWPYGDDDEVLLKKVCKEKGCYVSVNHLISEGYIDENLKDPKTKKVIDDTYKVKVFWKDMVKTCELEISELEEDD